MTHTENGKDARNAREGRRKGRRKGLLLALSALLVALDQWTKYLSDTRLAYAEPYTVFPGFDLLLVYNTGAAFSFLSNDGGWQRLFLAGLSLVVSIMLVVWILRLSRRERLLGLALALVLGGAVGNLIDRLALGYVIDFISVYYRDWRFATFNVADAAISAGAALMVLDLLLGARSGQGHGNDQSGNDEPPGTNQRSGNN